MYITLLTQNIDTLRGAQQYVNPENGVAMHRMLTWLQQSGRSENHILYRVMKCKNAYRVYVQSDTPLNTSNVDKYGFATLGCVEVNFDKGRNIRFTMRVHPTIAHNGRPEYLKESVDRMSWCKRKLNDSGLNILQLVETGEDIVRFSKNRTKDTVIACCDIAGIATIEDPVKFESFVRHGVGKLKNYGAGMFVFN